MTPEVEFVRREWAMVASLVDSLLLCFGMVDLGSSIFDVFKSVAVDDSAAIAGGDCGGGIIVVGMVSIFVFGRGVEDDNDNVVVSVVVVVGGGRVPVVGTTRSSGDSGGVGVLVAVGPASCSCWESGCCGVGGGIIII